jgi:ribonuclease D
LQAGNPAELPPRFPMSAARRFHQAVRAAMEETPEQWPKRKFGKRLDRSNEAEKYFEELKTKRDKIAAELDLDPSLIASRSALDFISIKPDTVGDFLLNWQRKLLDL